MNRLKKLLEERAAKLQEWNTAAEAGDEAAATTAEQAVNKLDADIVAARAMEAKLEEARAAGAKLDAELSRPVREAVTTEARAATVVAGADRARFGSLAHQCREIRHLEMNHVPMRDGVIAAQREQRYAQGAGVSVQEDGGALVQEDFVNDLMPILLSDGGIPGRCQPQKVGGNRLIINQVSAYSKASSFTGAAISYWINEGTAITASQPKFETVSLELRKVAALVYATDELLEDAPQFASVLNSNVALELQHALADKILNGNGTGEPQGIIGLAPTISIDAETGQAAETLVFENLVKMFARFQKFNPASCVVLYNKGLETQFPALNAAVGVGGGLVYMPPGGLSASPYATMYGLPLIETHLCAARGTVGDIILADLSQYVLGMKSSGVQSAVSMHVAFTTAEQAFRFTLRVMGRPRLSAAITPKNCISGETLSPFVTLATRS
jgi:HK97 family phage major capsid protein